MAVVKNIKETVAEEKKPVAPTYEQHKTPAEATAYKNALEDLKKPGEMQVSYADQWSDVVNKINNREPFKYDINADALYQQYKDHYTRGGNLAMQDTIGKASALTGGYGTSYAQQVGQQTYNSYMQQLNDKIPELYQLALDQYNKEGDDLYKQHSMYSDLFARDYGMHRDAISDYNNERAYLTDAMRYADTTAYNRNLDAYNITRDAYDSELGNYWKRLEYGDAKQRSNQETLVAMMSVGYKPTEQELADAGLNSGMYNAYAETYNKNKEKEEQQELLNWIANGYEPRTSELVKVGIDPEKYNALKASQTADAQPKEIVPGSDVELAIMDAINGAETLEELAAVLRRYSKYDPAVLDSLAAKKKAELSPAEDDETGTDVEEKASAFKNPLEWALEMIRKSQKD